MLHKLKKYLPVFVVAATVFALAVLLSSQSGWADRVPDEKGHYLIAIPGQIGKPDTKVEVWGTSCSDLKIDMHMPKIYSSQEYSLLCLPYVDNIVDFLKAGNIESPGFIWFKDGPNLMMVPNAPSSKDQEEQQKKEKEKLLKFYGQLPPDAVWVRINEVYGGYIKFKGITPCPSSHPKANFCAFIDNYIHNAVHPKLDELYGVYCWKDCSNLKKSQKDFQKRILFGDINGLLFLDGAYAQPLRALREDYINKIYLLNQSEKGEKNVGQQ